MAESTYQDIIEGNFKSAPAGAYLGNWHGNRRSPTRIERELVVDKRGQPRQAGADREGEFVAKFRGAAESSLYFLAKAVLGLDRLTNTLHKPVAEWLQRVPPYRKLLLMPRDHLKTSIVSRSLPIHLLIQPAQGNIYFPGKRGADTRILLATETAPLGEKQLRWIETRFEQGRRLRALWPDVCWENPKKQSPMWNAGGMMLPRSADLDYPEGSIEVIGVGGAVTGRHYDVMLKDDLVTLEAANSAIVMHAAIEWHKSSRALFDDIDRGLEFIIGTRWAVYDLYDDIQKNDPSVEVLVRSAIEDGIPIFPEMFSLASLQQLRKELGVLFPLLYLNTAVDASISDFHVPDIRHYEVRDAEIHFDEDERDLLLAEWAGQTTAPAEHAAAVPHSGLRLSSSTHDIIFGRGEYFTRLKRA